MRTLLRFLPLLVLPCVARADGDAGHETHLHLRLQRNFLNTEAVLTWDGAGTERGRSGDARTIGQRAFLAQGAD